MNRIARINCRFLIPAILAVCHFLPSFNSIAAEKSKPPVFSTSDCFEADKIASIWLIRRFINPEAEIKVYPTGSEITEGILFDMPNAKFRRYHNASTYEMLMKHYVIEDHRCKYISKIIHDIEINTWEKKVMPETHFVQKNIQTIITTHTGTTAVINSGLQLFDTLYNDIDLPKAKAR